MRATINLYNSDCMKAMAKMEDNAYDLAIVDPPYGIGADKANNSNKGRFGFNEYHETDWDSMKPGKEYFKELFRISKNQIVWGGNYFVEYLPPRMCWIFWDKKQYNFSFSDGELAWTSFNTKLRVFKYTRSFVSIEKTRIHPTQKPLQLYKWLLQNYAKEGDKILDTHGGSMSIAIACWDLCFDLDLYEIDKDYFEAGCARLERHKDQGQLF